MKIEVYYQINCSKQENGDPLDNESGKDAFVRLCGEVDPRAKDILTGMGEELGTPYKVGSRVPEGRGDMAVSSRSSPASPWFYVGEVVVTQRAMYATLRGLGLIDEATLRDYAKLINEMFLSTTHTQNIEVTPNPNPILTRG